jgi:hypothetical protein
MITRPIKVGDRLRWLDGPSGSSLFVVKEIDYARDLVIDTDGDEWSGALSDPEHFEHVDEPQADAVNHPPHYTAGEIECIDAIRAALGRDGFIAYCRGNAIKYLWRCEHKGGTEDLRKAAWYLGRAIKEAGK